MASNLRDRAQQIKEKRPGYAKLLDFYVAIWEAQQASKPFVKVDSAKPNGGVTMPAFPLIGNTGFPVDINSAASLFDTLCRLGDTANQYLASQVKSIKQAVADGQLNLEGLLAGGGRAGPIEQTAIKQGLDAQVLSFLVFSSTRPSIEAARDQLLKGIETAGWRECTCPVCSSPPVLSLLEGDPARRHSLCSYCGHQWRVDRVSCSCCGNNDPDSLQSFFDEDEKTCRIELCDKCHQYVKTIDCRSLEESDPSLEDLATLHLDVVATEKGYSRVVPSLWITRRESDS
jgi:FdhE protein